MATDVSTSTSGTENQVVGNVVILYGTVKAIAPDGSERVLTLNSPIFAFDRIVTESDGRVSIQIDGTQTQIDLGRMSDMIIDEDIFAGATQEDIDEVTAEVEEIQELLLAEDFDPTLELEAAAAGGDTAAGGGHPTPDFERVTHEGEIGSGAPTDGITTDNPDPIEGTPDTPEPPAPSISVTSNAEGGIVPEGEDAVFTVSIGNAIGGSQLNLNLTPGTADPGDAGDYNETFEYSNDGGETWQEYDPDNPIILVLGDNEIEVRVNTNQDTFDEPNEDFTLNAEITGGETPISDSADAIIVDDDEPIVIVSDETVIEGEDEIFTISVNNVAEGSELTLTLGSGGELLIKN